MNLEELRTVSRLFPNLQIVVNVTAEDITELSAQFRKERSRAIVLKSSINEVGFRDNIVTPLNNAGIKTFGDLVKRRKREIIALKGIGKVAVNQLEYYLSCYEIKWL